MQRMVRRFGALVCCLVLVGCGGGNPLTTANYEKVQTGMSQAEVEAVLGKGEETSSTSLGGQSGKSLMWKDKSDPAKNVVIMFMNDKVMSKAQIGLK